MQKKFLRTLILSIGLASMTSGGVLRAMDDDDLTSYINNHAPNQDDHSSATRRAVSQACVKAMEKNNIGVIEAVCPDCYEKTKAWWDASFGTRLRWPAIVMGLATD